MEQQERSQRTGHVDGVHQVIVSNVLVRHGLQLGQVKEGTIGGGIEAHGRKWRAESRGGAQTVCKSGGCSLRLPLVSYRYCTFDHGSKLRPFFASLSLETLTISARHWTSGTLR